MNVRRSSRGPSCDTDHYLVKIKVKERIASTQEMERAKLKKWDLHKLQEDKEIQQNYQRKIEVKIREYKEKGNVERNWKRIEKIIKEAADETVSREGNQGNKEWFDEECAKVVLEKNARKRMLQTETRINYGRYQELKREVKRICKKKKRMKRQLEEVHKFKDQNERRKLYKAIESLKKGFQARSTGCRNTDGEIIREEEKILRRWEEY
jgi:hypothetical protein